MSSLERVLLFVHVLTVVIWLGGVHIAQLATVRAVRSGDDARIAVALGDLATFGRRIFLPTAVLLVLSGAWLVSETGYAMSASWISAGWLVWLVATGLGLGLTWPQAGRSARALAEGGRTAELDAGIRRILLVSRLELAVLLLGVFAMTTKLWA